jgi:hypothetical protein
MFYHYSIVFIYFFKYKYGYEFGHKKKKKKKNEMVKRLQFEISLKAAKRLGRFDMQECND